MGSRKYKYQPSPENRLGVSMRARTGRLPNNRTISQNEGDHYRPFTRSLGFLAFPAGNWDEIVTPVTVVVSHSTASGAAGALDGTWQLEFPSYAIEVGEIGQGEGSVEARTLPTTFGSVSGGYFAADGTRDLPPGFGGAVNSPTFRVTALFRRPGFDQGTYTARADVDCNSDILAQVSHSNPPESLSIVSVGF